MGSCTLARIPVVVGYVGGTATSRKRAFLITLSFVAGLVLTYTCIGVLLGTVAAMTQHLVRWSTLLYYLIGAVAIFIGLYLLGFLRFRFPRFRHDRFHPKHRNLIGAFFFGIIFATFESPACPCCGPVIFLIAAHTFAKGRVIYGLSLFFTYALGQSLPILVIGSMTGVLKHIGQKAHLWEEYVEIGGGIILTLLGIYFIWMA